MIDKVVIYIVKKAFYLASGKGSKGSASQLGKIFGKALGGKKNKNSSFKANMKSQVRQSLGGRGMNLNNLFKTQKNTLPQEYQKVGTKYSRILESLTPEQSEQFKKYIVDTLFKRMEQGKENRWEKGYSNWFNQQLKLIINKVDRIAKKYYSTGKLTKGDKAFITKFQAFFSEDLLAHTHKNKVKVEKRGGYREPPKIYPKNESSWIKWFSYKGKKKGENANGMLRVRMQPDDPRPRQYPVYMFPNFPYVEYILLCHVGGSIGEWWWKKYLWKYSAKTRMYYDKDNNVKFKRRK